jgi:hypothetical protein
MLLLIRTSAAALLVGLILTSLVLPVCAKEYLTPLEVQKIQDAQEIDSRVKIYLEAAILRIRTANDRLLGKESAPGDPLEFFSVEEMVDGYYQIIRSVMMNLDDAAQKPATERSRVGKALKDLRNSTETAVKELAIVKKSAEDQQKEALWNLATRAIDIANGAHDGAELALSQETPADKKKPKK